MLGRSGGVPSLARKNGHSLARDPARPARVPGPRDSDRRRDFLAAGGLMSERVKFRPRERVNPTGANKTLRESPSRGAGDELPAGLVPAHDVRRVVPGAEDDARALAAVDREPVHAGTVRVAVDQ